MLCGFGQIDPNEFVDKEKLYKKNIFRPDTL